MWSNVALKIDLGGVPSIYLQPCRRWTARLVVHAMSLGLKTAIIEVCCVFVDHSVFAPKLRLRRVYYVVCSESQCSGGGRLPVEPHHNGADQGAGKESRSQSMSRKIGAVSYGRPFPFRPLRLEACSLDNGFLCVRRQCRSFDGQYRIRCSLHSSLLDERRSSLRAMVKSVDNRYSRVTTTKIAAFKNAS